MRAAILCGENIMLPLLNNWLRGGDEEVARGEVSYGVEKMKVVKARVSLHPLAPQYKAQLTKSAEHRLS